jgi:hypothetical protein
MTSQGPVKGVTINISVSGVLIFCSKTIKNGDELQIIFKSSGDYEQPINCKKIWSKKKSSANSGYNTGGLLYTKLSSNVKKFIAALVAKYSPA